MKRAVILGSVMLALSGCSNSATETVDVTMSPVESPDGSEVVAGQAVNLVGRNMTFSPNVIRAKRGETVTVNFTSQGGVHDWVLDEFNVAIAATGSGSSASVTFVASKAGTFEYYCSVGKHRQMGMKGNLIVE